IQYADYTLWQRDWLQGDVLAEQIAYWKRQLAGPLPVLELPTARPRPPQQTFNGTVQQVSLSQEIMERLTHVGQKQGATLFMTLLAAFKSLLHRYTGQEDIIVGTPIANRRHPKLEELIGFFVNTLAMRTDLSGDPTFAELVENVRQVALDAYAYQDVPFEKLVEELQPDRDISQSPLFRVMFILQNTGEQQLRLPGVEIEGVDFVTKTAKFDLILYFVQQEDGLHGGVEYNTDLFDGETMARMMGHFVNLLEAIVADPGRKVSELRMLSQAEEKMLLQEWNRSGEAEHGAMSGVATPVSDADNDAANATNATNAAKRIDDLISLQAALTPDEVAVVYEDDVLTYRQLDERANQLAHVLQELGVGADRFVGLYLERSTDMIVGLLAVLKAGGAYLPLDASYPQERLSFILEDTQAPVILTHTSLRDRLPSGIWQAVCLDSEETLAILDAKSTLAPASNSTESNLAYAIYTSGSTGKPKGVLIEHRNAMHCFNGLNQLFDVSAQEAVLAVASIGFDITVHELIWSLTRGIKLVLLAREEVLQAGESASPYSLAAQARRHRVTRLVCTPTLMNQLLSKEEVVDSLSSVHTLCLGGEALTPALLSLVHRTLPVARLFNLYGPTEAAVWSTAHEVVQEVVQEDHEVQTVSIGRALPGTRLYVLDRHGQPVPLGVPGELCIGGDGVARGYLNRPDLTAARFIPNPFVKDGEDRLYKTGDLVRYRADGTLLFLGRIDHQVKIKGHRIELGEIESVLNRHPQVRESAVVARPDSQGALRLVAYVAPVQAQTQQTPLQATDLRRYLQAELPDYMVPAFWEVLDRLPTTHSGKIDRNALPDPSGERQEASGYVAPRDRFEFEMVGLWEEVLQTRPIGVLDNFFALGGESFRAVRLTAEAKRRLGVSLPLSLLFQTPTVAELCAQLRNGEEEEVTANLLPIRLPVEGRGEAPLFLFHPYRGGVLCYAPLAHALGEEVPIYGLQAVGFSSDEEPLDDIGAMAERYLHEIRQRQPHGPYRLAGWSMGGLIAYETAKRLELEGEQVEYLGLIDTAYTVRDDSLAAYDWMDESLRLQAYAAQQFPTESEQVAKADVVQAYDYLLQQAKTHQVLPPHATLDMLKRDIKLVIAHALAQARYTCEGGVQADIHLYHVTETEDRYGVPLVAPEQWEASTSGQVKAIELPGHHFSLVEPPHVTQLAQAMQAALHKVTT
ncbi:MAG TPA: amino acid adenylation domain-containing protein, partial [Bacilli bacterium]|nr:amino acid adenylation domain-containing protein [Bacilli bacterium]